MNTGCCRFWEERVGGRDSGSRLSIGAAAVLLAVLWLLPGCTGAPANEDFKKEVQALKGELGSLKERLAQVEAGQKILLELVKEFQKAKAATPESPGTVGETPGVQASGPPGQAAPLSVAELFKNRNQLLGARVTVRGLPGPVMVHKKTLFLGGPGGMVEVLYGNLQDKKQVERLNSQAIDTPITVSGLLAGAPGQAKDPARLQIMADAVDF